MAKTTYPGSRGGPEEVTFNFRFQINSTFSPDAFVGSGGLVTGIVRDADGEFSITLDKNFRFQDVITCHVSTEDIQTDGDYVSWTQATGVLEVITVDGDGTTTMVAGDPADDSWVHVSLTMCRRSNLATSQAI